jgi:sec-independent protein translocase protein TatB
MNLGFSEMAFIFLLALIIFGPKKLPEIGRQIGKVLAEFKRASNEFKWQLESEMRQIEAEATRERLAKEAKAPETAPTILPPAPEEPKELKPKPPDAEIYTSNFGVEFRPTTPAPGPGSELVDVPDVKPPAAKGQDA